MGENEKYSEIVQTPEFQRLLKAKRKFIVPVTIFFAGYFILLPIFTSYSTILNKPFIGSITWTWAIAFTHFIMTWVLSGVYICKTNSFDKISEQISEQIAEKNANQNKEVTL
ncbi:DUF485 domain-containing protein [Scopulibacillus cellulosilyticus]|uniref:DUF485 domain-containing protein n=1 Tax=Scopulibacillus cellulosilyticus TaxID=2665665 RepID=A0ABW2Q014_9BACL